MHRAEGISCAPGTLSTIKLLGTPFLDKHCCTRSKREFTRERLKLDATIPIFKEEADKSERGWISLLMLIT
jgi:hypothetical protein